MHPLLTGLNVGRRSVTERVSRAAMMNERVQQSSEQSGARSPNRDTLADLGRARPLPLHPSHALLLSHCGVAAFPSCLQPAP